MTPTERRAFETLLTQAPAGPRIEFGVFKGDTLRLMMKHPGQTIGVDSFAGMAKPSKRDIKGDWNPYPKGRLATDPPKLAGATLIQGFVPGVLAQVPEGPYAFAHLDMDHYWPTLHALEWLWPRLLPGAILCGDDWFADRDWLAAGAINHFAKRQPLTGTCERKAWWVLP